MTDQPPRNGIGCPACGCNDSEVVQTRTWFGQIYRRRACRACGQRWSTIERPVVRPPPEVANLPVPEPLPDPLPPPPKPRRPRGKKMLKAK